MSPITYNYDEDLSVTKDININQDIFNPAFFYKYNLNNFDLVYAKEGLNLELAASGVDITNENA